MAKTLRERYDTWQSDLQNQHEDALDQLDAMAEALQRTRDWLSLELIGLARHENPIWHKNFELIEAALARYEGREE